MGLEVGTRVLTSVLPSPRPALDWENAKRELTNVSETLSQRYPACSGRVRPELLLLLVQQQHLSLQSALYDRWALGLPSPRYIGVIGVCGLLRAFFMGAQADRASELSLLYIGFLSCHNACAAFFR